MGGVGASPFSIDTPWPKLTFSHPRSHSFLPNDMQRNGAFCTSNRQLRHGTIGSARLWAAQTVRGAASAVDLKFLPNLRA